MSKSFLIRFAAACLSLALLIFSIASCDEDEPEPQGPSIDNFSPTVGVAGTVVTINGKNFDATAANNTVKFSNIAATVSAATATSLKVTVPADAVTGKIEVTTNNGSALSATDFVIPPVITDFSPKSGVAGSNITITGKGFSSTATGNIVKFDGAPATVTAASATSLTVQAPTAGYSGKISVDVGSASVMTTDIFKYVPVITGFDPIIGPVNSEISITGSGFNKLAANNIVKIGNVAAKVGFGSASQLVVKVAEGTETGLITVSTDGSVATSAIPYTVILEAWSIDGIGGIGAVAGNSIALDAAGNSYVAGSFMGTATFGSTVLTGPWEEIFVAKYDPQGKLVWAVNAGSTGVDRASSIAVDNAGNSYITGHISDGAQFGSLPPITAPYSTYVAKLNTSGEFQWVQPFGGDNADIGKDIALDNDGNPVVVGSFFGTVDVGATEIVSPGPGTNIFVAKFNKSSGTPIWAKGFGETYEEIGMTVTVNKDGDIYAGASFFGTITIGSEVFDGGAGLNSFVMKLDNMGELLWAKQVSGPNWNNVFDLAADANGNCVMTGYFRDQVTIAGKQLSGIGREDMFLAKLESADGDAIFLKKAGGTEYDNGRAVAIDGAGNIYVAGYYEREAMFDTSSVFAEENSRDVFIAKYNSEGTLSWVKSAGGNEDDRANDVCVGSDGKIYLTGTFRKLPATFGSTVLENEGGDYAFVYRILQ